MVGFLGLYSQATKIWNLQYLPSPKLSKRPMGYIAHLIPVPIYENICAKLWLCPKIKRKKSSSPCWELNGPLSINNWIPFTQRCTMPSLVDINLVVLHKKLIKYEKSLQTDRHTTNGRRSEKLTSAFSSGELKITRAQVESVEHCCTTAFEMFFSFTLKRHLQLKTYLSCCTINFDLFKIPELTLVPL